MRRSDLSECAACSIAGLRLLNKVLRSAKIDQRSVSIGLFTNQASRHCVQALPEALGARQHIRRVKHVRGGLSWPPLLLIASRTNVRLYTRNNGVMIRTLSPRAFLPGWYITSRGNFHGIRKEYLFSGPKDCRDCLTPTTDISLAWQRARSAHAKT